MNCRNLIVNCIIAALACGAAVRMQMSSVEIVIVVVLSLLTSTFVDWVFNRIRERLRPVTPEVYIKHTVPRPCGAARSWLLSYQTVRQAWLSDTAFPEFLLWAVCVHRGVSNAELTRMIKRLIAAGLTSWKPDVDIGDKRYSVEREPLSVQGATRYSRAPTLEWCVSDSSDTKQAQPAQMAAQRRIMREEFPHLFVQSIAQFRKEQAGLFKPD